MDGYYSLPAGQRKRRGPARSSQPLHRSPRLAGTKWRSCACPRAYEEPVRQTDLCDASDHWRVIDSPRRYAPTVEMALVAGIEALLDYGPVIEPTGVRQAVTAYQKAHPFWLPLTVNRMSDLAHARSVEEPLSE